MCLNANGVLLCHLRSLSCERSAKSQTFPPLIHLLSASGRERVRKKLSAVRLAIELPASISQPAANVLPTITEVHPLSLNPNNPETILDNRTQLIQEIYHKTASHQIKDTPFGTSRALRLWHPENACFSMRLRPEPASKVTRSRELHEEKQPSPRTSTLFGTWSSRSLVNRELGGM